MALTYRQRQGRGIMQDALLHLVQNTTLALHAAVLTTRVVSGAGPGTSAPPKNDFLRMRITSMAAPSRSSASPTSERVTGTAICQVGRESAGGDPDGASSLARNGDGRGGTGGGGGGDGGGIPSAAQ